MHAVLVVVLEMLKMLIKYTIARCGNKLTGDGGGGGGGGGRDVA